MPTDLLPACLPPGKLTDFLKAHPDRFHVDDLSNEVSQCSQPHRPRRDST
jgi:hypothetical protein